MAPKIAKKLAGKRKADGDVALKTRKKPRPQSGISANWGKSKATDLKLRELEAAQLLPPQEEIHWRGASDEIRAHPGLGEVIVFTEVTRGFRPPGSLFFRQVLHNYGLRLQDIGPNSVLNISNFVVLC